MKLNLYQVDAFTSTLFKGNPAAVVPLEKWIDDELMQLISQRMSIAEKIGEYKRNNNVTILQATRWNEVLEKALLKAGKVGLSDEFITRYMDAILMESINRQNKIMND